MVPQSCQTLPGSHPNVSPCHSQQPCLALSPSHLLVRLTLPQAWLDSVFMWSSSSWRVLSEHTPHGSAQWEPRVHYSGSYFPPTYPSLAAIEWFFHSSLLSSNLLYLLAPCAYSQLVTLVLISVRTQQQLEENVPIPQWYPLLPTWASSF